MTEHLLDHVRPYLDQPIADRVAFVGSPRWIGYDAALKARPACAICWCARRACGPAASCWLVPTPMARP